MIRPKLLEWITLLVGTILLVVGLSIREPIDTYCIQPPPEDQEDSFCDDYVGLEGLVK